ncbi:MAG TPA: NAD(P)/FAD-dependent oxidoreductase [Bryobacteraceae bacterium]
MTELERARDLVCASDVTIVGGGVAGLATGLLFSARGITAAILERYPDPRLSTRRPAQSINLALSHRGLRTLETIGSLDEMRDRMVPMYGRMVHGPASDSFQPYDGETGSAIYSVRRDEIVNVLLRQAGGSERARICFRCACGSIDLRAKTLLLEDPATGQKLEASFQRLIGADGCHSIVRQAIVRETGAEDSVQCLDHGFKELELGPEIASRLQPDRNALHIWPGGEFMLIALPNPGGSFTATLFMPRSGPESFEALGDRPVDKFLRRYLPRHAELIPALSESFASNAVGRLITVSATPWHFGDAALILGDAAHAMTPFFGQGMNCALEDCRLLLEYFDRQGGDWSAVFGGFESTRGPDTNAISLLSMNNYVEMRRSVIEGHYLRKREINGILKLRHPDRFLPLYPMVALTSIPYSEALRRHLIQDEIVERLCALGDPIDLELADREIAERLTPLPTAAGLRNCVTV